MALHFAQRLGPPMLVILAYSFVAGAIVHADMARVGEPVGDYVECVYSMWTQLFFEPTAALPHAPVARLLFWLTPIVGVVLIAEGLLKVGTSLFDANERRNVWVRIMAERMQEHVVVCGLGHVGYRVVEELQRLGEPIVAIEQRESDFLELVRALGVPVIVGDARRDELLVEAGIERARAVVCATDDDLANLEIALDAKRMNPSVRVVLRMFDQRLAQKVGGALELDETFSTSAVAAPLVALRALEPGVHAAYPMPDGTTRISVELVLRKAFDGSTIDAIEAGIPGRVVGVRRAGEASFETPKGSTQVRSGDAIMIDAKSEDLVAIREKLA